MYDVIVIGVGSMGSSACYHLARRGLKVLGLEQFRIVHEEGSHAGQSRLIRKAYFEHPDYVPLLESAYSGWRKLEQAAGEQLFWPTGIAYFAEPNDEIIQGILKSGSKYNIPLVQKAPADFPALKLPKTFTCLLEPEAGFLSPERGIRTLVNLARERGVEILEQRKAIEWRVDRDGITVVTNEKEFRTRKLVFTSGPFTHELLDIPLKVTRQYLGWTRSLIHKLGELPCWVISDERPGIFYGFPAATGLEGPEGMKIAYHRPGEAVEASDSSELEIEILDGVLNTYFTDRMQVGELKTCKYTYSPDEHFIVDHLPGTDGRVIVATGFSGHGFKFVPVVGDILADLVAYGQTSHPTGFLGLSRFG